MFPWSCSLSFLTPFLCRYRLAAQALAVATAAFGPLVPFGLVASGMAAIVAVRLASDHPELVKHITLIGPNGFTGSRTRRKLYKCCCCMTCCCLAGVWMRTLHNQKFDKDKMLERWVLKFADYVVVKNENKTLFLKMEAMVTNEETKMFKKYVRKSYKHFGVGKPAWFPPALRILGDKVTDADRTNFITKN